MSKVRPDIDLNALQRPDLEPAVDRPRRSRWRVIVPASILAAFLLVLLLSVQEFWRGATTVTVLRPRAVGSAGVAATAGTPLFQAAGWVEPEPFPVVVTALAEGVVQELRVQESDKVAAGDVVALLFDADARIALSAAQAELERANVEHERSVRLLPIVEKEFAAALDVRNASAAAEADAVGKTAQAAHRRAAVAKGTAELRVAEEELAVQSFLAENAAAGPRQVQLAQARVEVARADLEILKAEAALAEAEQQKAAAELERARRDLELRSKDSSALETARAEPKWNAAAVRAAQARVEEAELRLERMSVRAPLDGVVLQRLAMPGTVVGAAGAPLCTLYVPQQLRIRVDVPQAEVAKVEVGQKAQILSESRSAKPYSGEVLRVVQQADIQKVTLQVHVRVLESDERLRPEMLVQVRFLSSGGASAAPQEGTVEIPAHLVDAQSRVWVVDAERRARQRSIERGLASAEWVEVRSGLNLSDKLIDRGRDAVADGARVKIEGEQ